jgi:hypothetical protein
MAEKLRRGLPLTAAERQKMAVTLRMSGATYRRIGEALGVSHVQAKRYCDRAFEQHATDSIEQLRMIQFSRIEHMIMLLWPQVNTRDIAAIHTVRALMNDENTIMGVGAGETSSITTSSRTIIATGNKEEFVKALQEARATQQREEEALEQEAQEPQEEEDPADTQADAS